MSASVLASADAEIISSLDPLVQPLALKHRDACLRRGLPYYFTAGGRDWATQALLREKLGTGAAPAGKSKHEVGAAWDANNMASRPMTDAQWAIFGAEAENLGLVWGGRFASRDMGHVEMPQTRAEIKAYRNLKLAAVALAVGVVLVVAKK
jgi:hypothetical protein